MPEREKPYIVGVMKVIVEEPAPEDWHPMVDTAVQWMKDKLGQELSLSARVFEFSGPHLSPAQGSYNPLDFLQLGISEKLEREIDFLLVITEVDLSASSVSYTLALPSQLTNIAVISTKRLNPSFWGDPPDDETASRRLGALMMHSFGHLVGLPHSGEKDNVMFDFGALEDLDRIHTINARQQAKIRQNLPKEALEQVSDRNRTVAFTFRTLARDFSLILWAVLRANPLRLVTRLPTMITTGISVILVLFFAPEIWDVASTVDPVDLGVFAVVALVLSTGMLYRSFSLGTALSRKQRLSESNVVTAAVSLISLFLTVVLLFLGFALLMYLGIVVFFPERLMETWPTVDPAVRTIDHVRLSFFLASIGVLAGSLGGRADSQGVVRSVIFLDEET